jgi:capsular polysaccharide transport system permease protein
MAQHPEEAGMTKQGLELVKTNTPVVEGKSTTPSVVPDVSNHTKMVRPYIQIVGLVAKDRTKFIAILSFVLIVMIPTAIYGTYVSLFASPLYKSEFRVLVRSSTATKSFDLTQMFSSTGIGKSSEDPYAIIQYLKSPQGVSDIEKEYPLRKIFSSNSVDFFSRLDATSYIEGLTRYWNKHLNAYYEATTGTVVVEITAFDPVDALTLSKQVLAVSEQLVNQMSDRSRNDLVGYSKKAVEEAEKKLQSVGANLLDLRNRDGVLDPQKYANVNIEQIGKLQEEISALRAKMTVQRDYLSADSPNMQLNGRRLDALEQELKSAQSKITSTSPNSEGVLSTTLKDFEQLQVDKDFAQKAYQASLASLQSAQTDAARQKMYLDTVVAPTLAEEQWYPKPFLNTATVFSLVSLGWLLLLILGASIRDHL